MNLICLQSGGKITPVTQFVFNFEILGNSLHPIHLSCMESSDDNIEKEKQKYRVKSTKANILATLLENYQKRKEKISNP